MPVVLEHQWSFDKVHSEELNRARLEHLTSLDLPVEGKRVLEVGSGIGKLTHFFEERDCDIISTEGRLVNVVENLHRHPYRKGRVFWVDLENEGAHRGFGEFDIVFFYGTLYHLGKPIQVIEELASVCTEMMFISTRVWLEDDYKLHFWKEDNLNQDSALHGAGCLPARNWLIEALDKYFEYVYMPECQPKHPEYPEWNGSPMEKVSVRSVFIASRIPLRVA